MMRALRTSRRTGLALALVLGVAAFGATAAHAEVGAEWRVSGAAVTDALKAQIQVTELETLAATGIKEGILLAKSGLNTINVHCKEIKFVDALLQVLGVVLGKTHFDSCTTELNGVPKPDCIPHSPGSSKDGLIETNTLKGLIKLHTMAAGAKVDQLEVKPDEGTKFVTIVFGNISGSECAIKTFDVTGAFFAEAGSNGEFLTEQTSRLFLESKELRKLLFGGNEALIDGSAKAALTGAHAGLNWSGVTK